MLALALLFALPLDPDLLDRDARGARYYQRIDLQGWSRSGSLVYEAEASGDGDSCFAPLVWKARTLAVRDGGRTTSYRQRAEVHRSFRTEEIQGPLIAEWKGARCEGDDSAIAEFDAGAPAEDGGQRRAALGSLTPVCKLAASKGSCPSPDGAAALEVAATQGKRDSKGCRNEQIRFLLRRKDGSTSALREFAHRTCETSADRSWQVSWSTDSKQLAISSNVQLRHGGATAQEAFARLDVLPVPAR